MRSRFVLALVFVSACGGSTADDGDGGASDAAVLADAAPSCGSTWRLVDVPAASIALIDPSPVNTARSVRVVVNAEYASGCRQLAAPEVVVAADAPRVDVTIRAWEALGVPCTDDIRMIDRPITLTLPRPGTWTVHAGSHSVDIEVGIAPSRPCAPGGGGPCGMDCDCAAGERCLGGNGFGGPFLACAIPCELDRDCAGNGACINVADGLSYACEASSAECTGAGTCPDGFTCAADVCEADYTLGQATRVPCDCDADCDRGLRCVEPQGAGERRCEVACPTASSAFCTGAHYCGTAAEDTAGLAQSDAVCVWAGD